MITHTMPLEDINKAFDLMHAGESLRSVVVFSGGDRDCHPGSRASGYPGRKGKMRLPARSDRQVRAGRRSTRAHLRPDSANASGRCLIGQACVPDIRWREFRDDKATEL